MIDLAIVILLAIIAGIAIGGRIILGSWKAVGLAIVCLLFWEN